MQWFRGTLAVGVFLSGSIFYECALANEVEDWLKARPADRHYRGDANPTPLFDSIAASSGSVQSRCNEESLGVEGAIARVKWAEECRILTPAQIARLLFIPTDDGSGVMSANPPYYPIFVTKTGPTLDVNSATIWSPNLGSCSVPANVVYALPCRAGCYEPEERLATSIGEMPIADALEQQVPEIQTINALTSTTTNLQTIVRPVDHYIESISDDAPHKILTFTTVGDHAVRVTTNHPLVDGRGAVGRADALFVGDTLLRADGTAEAISSITESVFTGKVYNVEPKGMNPEDNLIIVEGFVNGSNRFQNELATDLNRTLLRQSIPDNVVR